MKWRTFPPTSTAACSFPHASLVASERPATSPKESPSMPLRTAAAAVTCLALLAVLPGGAGLRCYSCLTKRSDPSSCRDPYEPQPHHERDCPPAYKDPVCYKVVLNNNADPSLGAHLFSRGCVAAEHFTEVAESAHAEDGVRVTHAFQCTHDLCNA